MSFMYRFRKVSDYSIRELMDDEIWGSTSDLLNDPFECKIAYNFDLIKKKLGIASYGQDFVCIFRIIPARHLGNCRLLQKGVSH